MASAQQYSHDITPGLGPIGHLPLLKWVRQHVEEQHAPPNDGWACCLSTGNADGFRKCWEAVLDPGDTLLIDELNFAFSTAQLDGWTGGRDLAIEPCPLGDRGIDAAALGALLASWTRRRPRQSRPSGRAPARPAAPTSASRAPTGRRPRDIVR